MNSRFQAAAVDVATPGDGPRWSHEAGQPAPRVLVSHPGRQHAHEVVLAAQQAGMLQGYLTSYYWTDEERIGRLVSRLTGSRSIESRYLKQRWNPEIDPSLVTTFPVYHLAARLIRAVTRGSAPDVNHLADVLFDRWASGRLSKQPSPTVVHGFEGSALLTLRRARRHGAMAVLDVPSAHEYLLSEWNKERERNGRHGHLKPLRRVAEERTEADLLLAPSQYVAQCLMEHGVAADRIALVPYGVDVERFSPAERPSNDGLFRVLFVGAVNFRKGIPDLLLAWRLAGIAGAELVIAGNVDIEVRKMVESAPANVRWVGSRAFATVHALYQASDVFVLPSLAEGSALVTYEAMAAGLPVIVTSNAGSVARDGIDGYVIASRDAHALATRLKHLYRNPSLRVQMGTAARQRMVETYTWKHYRARLAAAYSALVKKESVQQAVDRVG